MKKLYPAAALAIVLFGSFSVIKTQNRILGPSRPAVDTVADLPDSYTKRHFLSEANMMSDNAGTIPGNIVAYDPSSQTYSIRTMAGLIKNHAVASMQKPDNGLIYQGQVTPTSSLNGSYVINELKAENGQVIDLEIRDDAVYAVPPGQIDTAAVKNAAQSISPDERKNFYYITAATVTTLNYRIHAAETAVDKASKKAGKVNKKLDDLAHNDTAKNGVYLKATPPKSNQKMPGSYNSGNTKMHTDKAISIQLTPLTELIK